MESEIMQESQGVEITPKNLRGRESQRAKPVGARNVNPGQDYQVQDPRDQQYQFQNEQRQHQYQQQNQNPHQQLHQESEPEDNQDEMNLMETLSKQGEEIEILEMNEDEIPYKKVIVRKGEQDQYDIQVFEEGEADDIPNEEFTDDDYDSAELSVPEERDPDEYVYSDQKDMNQFDQSSVSGNRGVPNDGSDYSNIQPLSVDELENLHAEVHGDREIHICSEPNLGSIVPQITKKSIFLNCYSEEIYDVLLEDLRKQYEHLIQNV